MPTGYSTGRPDPDTIIDLFFLRDLSPLRVIPEFGVGKNRKVDTFTIVNDDLFTIVKPR
jgi:hypothetical protein